MRRKIIMTILLMLSLATMLLPWFGGMRGVQEIYGTCMFHNPLAFTCILLIIVGIWSYYEHRDTITCIGFTGLITMEIYEFLTWHIMTITGKFDLRLSFDLCYPEFYFALMCMIVTFMMCKIIMKKQA